MSKRSRATAALALAALALAAAATTVTASGSNDAAKAQRTIGLIVPGPGSPIASQIVSGGRSAAAALGDSLAVTRASDAATQVSTIESLIAQHAAAIAVDTDQGPATVNQVLPALARARSAGIPTLSSSSATRARSGSASPAPRSTRTRSRTRWRPR